MSPAQVALRDQIHRMAGLDVANHGRVLRLPSRHHVAGASFSRSLGEGSFRRSFHRSISLLGRDYLTRVVAVRHIRKLWYFGVSEVRENSFLAKRSSDVLSAL